MSRWLKHILIIALVIIALLLSSMLIVPWQVKKQGIRWIAENTSRTLAIQKVSFNPFTLTLEMTGTALSETGGSDPFVSFSRLMLSVSARSIIDRALILDRLELDDPYVNIVLLGQGKFNFSDFMPAETPASEDPPEADQEPFHFSLNNIVITNGALDFNDRASAKPSHHEIRQLVLSVPFIGNIPYLTDSYVTPRLSALVNGAELKVTGQLKPFHDSLETELYVSFHDADLPFYAEHAPLELPVRVKQGSLDFEVTLGYRISEDEQPGLTVGGEFAVSDLDIREPDESPLLSSPTLLVSLTRADVFQQDIALAAVEIYEPRLHLDRDQAGRVNLVQLFSAPPGPEAAPTGEQEAGTLPLVLVDRLTLADGRILFRDDAVPGSLSEEIRDLQISVTGLSTHPDEQASATLAFHTDRDLEVELTGQVGLVPLQAALDVAAKGVPLAPYYPYLEKILTAPVAGDVALGAAIQYTPDSNILVERGQLTLRNLLVPFGDRDKFTLAELRVDGGTLNLQQRRVRLAALTLQGGDFQASILEDGQASPTQLLRLAALTEAPSGPEARDEAPPWQIDLNSVDLDRFKVRFTDQSRSGNPSVSLRNLTFHAESLSYPEARPSPFRLVLQPGSRGDVSLQGSLIHTPFQVRSQLEIAEMTLPDYNGFIPENLHLALRSGSLFANLAINLEQTKDSVHGDFSGSGNITRFDLRDRRNYEELLGWQDLNLSGVRGALSPFALHVDDVALSRYQANIAIDQDGRVNLATVNDTVDAVRETPDAKDAKDATAGESPETRETAQAPADITIDAVTLQGGIVSFTDRHLPSTFSTTMYELGGRVSGLSSDEQMQADVDLRGELENHSPLTVSGKINPLSRDLFADLTISFKDIDLSPLTPYSGTYLGYAIDKGKLYLDLDYTIEHRRITADNRVMIDQFTFGDTIRSKQATSLPVALAIALLKDRNDEIHLDIPVSGNLDDPDFSLAGTILRVLRNLLVKAATSPFSLLTAAFGGDEDFSSLVFPAGITTLTTDQQNKLAELADMLSKRPGLTLEISAFADQDQDPEAYRKEQLRQQMVAVKLRQNPTQDAAATNPGVSTIAAEEYPALLKTVYEEADFPRPRNAIGLLKELPVEEMEKLLLANIRAGEEELAELAKQRAMVVRNTLEGLKPELKPRLFLKKTDIYQAPDEGPASRVEFGISAK